MRKNGINRELRPIAGGVCVPEGYTANAVACGIRENGGLDFGMLFSKRRCSVACVYLAGKTQGAPVKISKRNMKNDYARAVLVNGGVANIFGEEGEKLALGVCDLFFPYSLERTETVVISTGEVGKLLKLSAFERGAKVLWQGLSDGREQSRKLAKAIQTDGEVREMAFEFDLGDYPCKIGAVFSGGEGTSPFVALLTTDANISSPMLQKALNAETKETVGMLCLGGAPTPNDTVCILANGRAGNYRIDCPDAEYKKFALALKAVLSEISKELSKRGNKKIFSCRVSGGVSKEVARAVAKAIVGSTLRKSSIQKGKISLSAVLFTLLSTTNVEEDKIQVRLKVRGEEILLYEDGRALLTVDLFEGKMSEEEEIELCLNLHEGNFQALARGWLE